jgi:segregation and condensation protein A
MNVEFKINDFEGPLDLLLHLIKEAKMDIMNIEIESITNQYMDYLHKQESMNLEIASEYLVLASELLEIKSKLLLPREKLEEDEEEIDPRDELVSRLLEYQAYKKITKVLKENEEKRSEIFTKSPENVDQYVDDVHEIQSDVTLDDLVEAFKRYLERQKENKPLKTKVTVKEISIVSRRRDIKNILRKKKRVSFFELFPIVSREYIVATFLTVLEMAKNREIRLVQEDTFSDITVEAV